MTEISKKDSASSPEKSCGVVMPISAIDNCDENHWKEVKSIVFEAVTNSGFKPRLVSDSEDAGFIHRNIITNLYNDDIVVCDVSGKNPNVMFELGMRLCFDKPTVIIKDDQTGYSFDTNIIEHIPYPRDKNYHKINEFKEKLANKITATYAQGNDTFFKNFSDIKKSTIKLAEITKEELLFEKLNSIEKLVQNRTNLSKETNFNSRNVMKPKLDICLSGKSGEFIDKINNCLVGSSEISSTEMYDYNGHKHIRYTISNGTNLLSTNLRNELSSLGLSRFNFSN